MIPHARSRRDGDREERSVRDRGDGDGRRHLGRCAHGGLNRGRCAVTLRHSRWARFDALLGLGGALLLGGSALRGKMFNILHHA
jgi:hypothetical protein